MHPLRSDTPEAVEATDTAETPSPGGMYAAGHPYARDSREASGPHPDRPPLPPRNVEDSIEAAAVDHLFQQFSTAAFVNILLAALVLLVLQDHVPTAHLLGWAGFVAGITGMRLYLQHAYLRAERNGAQVWATRYLALTGASGLVWGLAGPLFVPNIPPEQAQVLMVAIAGLTAGALPINAAVLRVYIVFVTATLTPWVATYFVLGGTTGVVLGTMAILYGVALVAAAAMFMRNLRQVYEVSARLNEANRELQLRASHDALTGLWNRHRFEAALDQEHDRVVRYGSRYALVMLDVDHFKQINDTHGHDVGDRVLRKLGDILRSHVRGPDQVARWGGEEFMILLPEIGLAAATSMAERLRKRVAEADFEGAGNITISIGATECNYNEARSTLLKRLDDALYRAKQEGRDRVVGAETPPQIASD